MTALARGHRLRLRPAAGGGVRDGPTPAEIAEQPPAPAAALDTEPPSGPPAALILAGGIGTFCMGIVTTLGEASTGIADGLQWNDRVGPLSGKTLITVIVFAAAWALLTGLWRRTTRRSARSPSPAPF
jgi:hypothetical protein